MSEVPAWVIELAADARALLGVEDGWDITLSMTPKVGDAVASNVADDVAAAVGGRVTYDRVYLDARIDFSDTLTNDARGQQIVLHEFAHLALAPLFEVAMRAFERLSGREAELLRELYSDTEERVIQRMVRGLLRTIAPPPPANGRIDGPAGI